MKAATYRLQSCKFDIMFTGSRLAAILELDRLLAVYQPAFGGTITGPMGGCIRRNPK